MPATRTVRPVLNASPDIFIDTSGWHCMLDTVHPAFGTAWNIYNFAHAQHGRVVTTQYIVVELVPLLTSRMPHMTRALLCKFVEETIYDARSLVVTVEQELYDRAWRMLTACTDKKWSFVDAVSFVLMNDQALLNALTTDHHFEQAGKIQLLPSEA